MMGQYEAARDDRAGEWSSSDREPFRRSYIDRDGLAWEVREIAGADVPGSRGAACLVFESSVVIRRVWEVPPDWRQLTPDQLADLSWRK